MPPNLAEQLAKLPGHLGAHVQITGAALAIGIAISLPTAIASARSRALRVPVLAVAGVIQTVPSLALLALMVPLLGAFGFWPALFALVLYSMLPVIRNTVTGIAGVDAAIVEAAHGVGMTPGQVLRKVELPLALPVILAGVRTAAVWVVGVATLATPVGQPSLGNYIFGGLQTRNWTAVLVGCGAAALLAIVLDLLLAGLERAAARRSRRAAGAAVVGLALVFGGGSLAPRLARREAVASGAGAEAAVATTAGTAAGAAASPQADLRARPVRVGAKTFTEQYILARLVEARLGRAGFAVAQAESLGSTVAFDALRTDQIDVYVDYTGTIWANYMKRTDVAPAWRVRAEVAAWLAQEHGIRSLGALGFENAYALAMRADRARALGVTSVADLARHAPSLRLGSDYEFFQRPEWTRLRETYGLGFAALVSFDSSFMYDAVRRGEVDVVTAFSSDGRITAYDLVVLEDPKQAFPPYDAILLLAPGVASNRELAAALRPLVSAIPVARMREANLMVDREDDKKTPTEAARWLDEGVR